MPFLAVGVEHKTSPLSIREAVAMDAETVAHATAEIDHAPAIAEIAILSTCNRTEIYLYTEEIAPAAAAVAAYLTTHNDKLAPYLQTWNEMDAVDHLFRVASGLESQALGEQQILAQVRETLETAQGLGSIGPNLHSLFRSAISCARQARAGTALGRINVSLGTQAVEVAGQALGGLEGRSALIVGGGEISRLVAQELRSRQIGVLYIANRTESVAVELATRYGARPARLADIPRLLPHVELVVSATSAPHFILTPEDIPDGITAREQPLLIIDLALPRDVDPALGALAGISLRDLDSLLPSGLMDHWGEDIRAMEAVIAAEVKEFSAWYLSRRVVPVITHLRAHVEAVCEAELRRVAPQLRDLTERERSAVESLTARLVDKMFHHLVTRLRLAAQSDPKLVEAAEFFFLHGDGGLFEDATQREQQMANEPQA